MDTGSPGAGAAAASKSLITSIKGTGSAPLAACLLLALLVSAPLGAEETGDLVIELSGMTSDAGGLVYAMWSGPEHWLESNPVREGVSPIENGASVINLNQLPYGQYAISVYHDKNANGKLDTGLFGIPKEPLGTSNDVKIRFGPPKYDDAAFILDQSEMTISIIVKKIF